NYARGMKKNRTETIALIIPSIWHPFFSEFAYHVEKELLKYNYKLFICNADSDSQNEIEYIEMLKQNKRRDNKHLAFIGSINMYENETILRSKGFREKAKELGVDVYNFEMKEPLINPEDQIRIFLQSHKEIDGIFTINDMMALRV
ncbi:type 1 periplasmic-binding domain-containing protein, partial [Streptococcus pneumoniae]